MSSTQHQLIEQCATRLRGIVEALDNIHDSTQHRSPHRWSTDLDEVHSSAESLLAMIKDQAPPSEDQLIAAGLSYPLAKEDAVQLWYAGFRSEVVTVLEAWEAIGHDIGMNPSKGELLDSLRNMAAICNAHGNDMPAQSAIDQRQVIADAITGALAFGAQASQPPAEDHWLRPFYDIGRAEGQRTQELAMLVRMLAASLKRHAPESNLVARATNYLAAKGLAGTPLRDPPAPVEQAGGDERAAFEAWATHLPMDRQPLRPDLYMPQTQWAWEAWQFRAALAQPSQSQYEASFEEWLANELEGEDGQPVPAAVCDITLARRAFNHWPKLEQPAKVGGVRFSAGVSSRLVVEAAQRLYEFESTPEQEAERPEVVAYRTVGRHAKHQHPHFALNYYKQNAEDQAAHWSERGCEVSVDELTTVAECERIAGALRADRDSWAKRWDEAVRYGARIEEQRDAALANVDALAVQVLKLGGTISFAHHRTDQAGQVPQAWLDVQAERKRQIEAEGWTPEHDDAHSHGEMARAAACYALAGSSAPNDGTAALLVSLAWPWDEQWWKPSTARRDMVKACALGLAEIERLDRAGISQNPQPGATTASS
ncbi:hypothetical protein [Pseudomonas aeruginosa]|uniref:hypothetical protein n=1 Tax=Pseudomonas aeruginosa TaxID=287 RepID=UPI000AA30F80|nr:hypothetical protein [Pseudomonas aeruginosa]SUC86034.1 Uncharacterised protein [Pseudomonas aeruginosa]